MHQVGDQRVDRVDRVGPRPAHVAHARTLREPAFLADHAADAREFLGHALVHGHDVVERVGQLALDASEVAGQPVGEIAGA